ncbi:hypothetical protein EDD11_000331, partial [Mortierella claussenii]
MNTAYHTYWASLSNGQITDLLLRRKVTEQNQVQLEDLLRLNPAMERIVLCNSDRCASILDFILSTRKRTLASGGSGGCALKVSFGIGIPHLEVAFPNAFDPSSMSIKINLRQIESNLSETSRIFLQYGSHIVDLDATKNLESSMVKSLEQATVLNGSALRSLKLSCSVMSTGSLEPLRQVVERSSSLEYFSFELDGWVNGQEQPTAQWWLDHCARKITKLVICSYWDGNLPKKGALPNLTALEVPGDYFMSGDDGDDDDDAFMDSIAQWIASMVAPVPLHSSWRQSQVPLKELNLDGVSLGHERWATIIKAMDFATMERLSFEYSDFSMQELLLLNECISVAEEKGAGDDVGLSLKELDLFYAHVVMIIDTEA